MLVNYGQTERLTSKIRHDVKPVKYKMGWQILKFVIIPDSQKPDR